MALWRDLVESLSGGKLVGDDRYLHVSALSAAQRPMLAHLVAMAGCEPSSVDVIKVSRKLVRVSLLSYPRFFDDPFPALVASWRLDLDRACCEKRQYRANGNPPILHRKEEMLAESDPRREAFAALTQAAEAHGLFRDTTIIGHRDQWLEELRARGLSLVGHTLVAAVTTDEAPVMRHRTAMARRALSTPMQALWRHGYLVPEHTLFDYGCGRGDDLAALQSIGLRASGWDPHFRPEAPHCEADVVNLGFVLNVIEDIGERSEALRKAFALTRKVLAVSVLVGGRTAIERFRLFRDGVLTARNTFQKYFAHAELGQYLADTLGREGVSVGPGLYFVFRDDAAEEDFLERRERSSPLLAPTPPARVQTEAQPRERKQRATTRVRKDEWPAAYDTFWSACLELGRAPHSDDFDGADALLAAVGSPTRALRKLIERDGDAAMKTAAARRHGDLLVFFALNLFERRRSVSLRSPRLRTDVRTFFGTLDKAEAEARTLLFSLREVRVIAEGCAQAARAGLGYHVEGDALHLDARLVNALPPVLRVYLGCAGKLLGEARDADVVKVHESSGKASLFRYDDYEGAAIPHLIERVKVDLRRQRVDDFQYGDEHPPQPLYGKSRYMHPSLEGYEAQRQFDEAVRGLAGWTEEGYGPALEALGDALEALQVPPGLTLVAGGRPARSRR